MRRIIELDCQSPLRPSRGQWRRAVHCSQHLLYSAHVPIRPDGSIETGDATRQTLVTLDRLRATLKDVGATPADVALVQIYLTSLDHKPAVDRCAVPGLE